MTAKVILTLAVFAAIPGLALAQGMNMGGSPADKANMEAMQKMQNDMAIHGSGNADEDFVMMMIPHHQGAIDMALAVLRHGRNPQIRRLAQEIIVTQQQEIAVMRLAVGQPLPPSTLSRLEGPSVRGIESKSSQPTDRTMEP